MPLPSEDSPFDPYASIREFLAQGQAQHSQAEAPLLEQEPDPAMADAQARDWRARLEELKGMMP